MTNRLGLVFLLLLLAACSSDSQSKPDAGDAGAYETLPDVGQALDGAFDALADAASHDAPVDAAQSDGSPLDGDTADTPLTEVHPDGNTYDTWSGEARPGDDASDGRSVDSVARDGAPLSCEEAVHDPLLGTAKLGSAFRVVDSAVLPVTSWLLIALVDEAMAGGGIGQVVYGYAGDGRVHRLGVWPQLAAPDATNLAFDAVLPADRTLQIVTTPWLVATRGMLLAGYRTLRSGAFVGGGVSLYDTAHPEAGARWIAATGVESALGLGSYFLVGGDGLGGMASGRGVYGVSTDTMAALPGMVAKYPVVAGENVRPGAMAATSGGLVVLGHYLDLAERNSLRLPEPSQLVEALSGGAPIDLASSPELTPADDVANFSSLGQGVAVLHTRKVRGILPALGRLDHYTLSRSGGDAGTAVGAPVTMLSSDDEGCTAVSQLVPVAGGMTIIVGLWDRNGQRLVRLTPR